MHRPAHVEDELPLPHHGPGVLATATRAKVMSNGLSMSGGQEGQGEGKT